MSNTKLFSRSKNDIVYFNFKIMNGWTIITPRRIILFCVYRVKVFRVYTLLIYQKRLICRSDRFQPCQFTDKRKARYY